MEGYEYVMGSALGLLDLLASKGYSRSANSLDKLTSRKYEFTFQCCVETSFWRILNDSGGLKDPVGRIIRPNI